MATDDKHLWINTLYT